MLRRKDRPVQFLKNFEAWRVFNFAPRVWHTFYLRDDRLMFQGNWEQWLDDHCDPWNVGISKHQPFGRQTAVRGWHEPVPYCSAQFILHDDPEHGNCFETDVDMFNAAGGLGSMFLHGIEYAHHRINKCKTDPYRVRKILRRRGINAELV